MDDINAITEYWRCKGALRRRTLPAIPPERGGCEGGLMFYCLFKCIQPQLNAIDYENTKIPLSSSGFHQSFGFQNNCRISPLSPALPFAAAPDVALHSCSRGKFRRCPNAK